MSWHDMTWHANVTTRHDGYHFISFHPLHYGVYQSVCISLSLSNPTNGVEHTQKWAWPTGNCGRCTYIVIYEVICMNSFGMCWGPIAVSGSAEPGSQDASSVSQRPRSRWTGQKNINKLISGCMMVAWWLHDGSWDCSLCCWAIYDGFSCFFPAVFSPFSARLGALRVSKCSKLGPAQHVAQHPGKWLGPGYVEGSWIVQGFWLEFDAGWWWWWWYICPHYLFTLNGPRSEVCGFERRQWAEAANVWLGCIGQDTMFSNLFLEIN